MKKYKIGYTQGTFDMFHIGHLNLLHQAKELCEELIVGVNTDHLVNEYKHKQPVVCEHDRAAIVGELRCVDKVVLCDTLSKTEAWQRLHFDAIFIGSDWKGNERWAQTERDLPLYMDGLLKLFVFVALYVAWSVLFRPRAYQYFCMAAKPLVKLSKVKN